MTEETPTVNTNELSAARRVLENQSTPNVVTSFVENHPKVTKGLAIGTFATLAVGGVSAVAVHEFTKPTASDIASASAAAELSVDQQQFKDAMDAPIKHDNLATDADGNIQVITIEAGNARPFDTAQGFVENSPAYEANPDFSDKMLLDSATAIGITQPGQKLYVEQIDVNKDGKDEFLVKSPEVGFDAAVNAQLPTPQSSQENN